MSGRWWSWQYWLHGRRIGAISRKLYPDFSSCGRCETSWGLVDGHSTRLTEFSGVFPLCEKCWEETTPEERLPYYRALWEDHMREVPEVTEPWKIWEDAVLNEAQP